jgi:TPR repeat protein
MGRMAAAILALLFLGACTIPRDCGGTGDEIDRLTCRAASGSKQAQLRLGKAYETGSGVAIDLKRAATLYRAASRPTSGTTYVYSPGVGKSRGQVLPLRTGPDTPGLPEATYRLGLMYRDGRGVSRDVERGERLIARAIAAGFLVKR